MKTNHRRDFLKKSILGLSGAALIPASIKASAITEKIVAGEAIPGRMLGKTGISIPVLSMGTGDTNNPALVKSVYEKGVRLFGTSSYYGNGNNESMLGGVFKSLPRESFMVATSAMPKGTDHQNGIFTDSTAGDTFKADVEAGMKRLGVEYLDILFLPFAAKRESVFFEPLLRVMEDFKKSGKVRYLGIATHSYMDQAIRAAADTKIYDVVMTAYNFRTPQMDLVDEAITYAAEAGMGMIAMKTMAGGFWDNQRTQPINAGAALRWVMQNKNIHTLMSGMTTFEELQANLAMVSKPGFTEEDRLELKLTSAGNTGLYCLQCRDCDGQCPRHADIPTLMRSYMYAYGYRNLHHARQTLDYVADASVCDNCDDCRVTCRAGFDVKHKIQAIARLKAVPQDFLMV